MIKAPLIAAIRAYQFLLSPWLGGSCRYWPTCSDYALEAIERHGGLRGGGLMLARLARCHPWGAGGVDLVPPARCDCAARHDAAPDTTEARKST